MSERLLRVESANELNQSQSDIQRDSTFHNKIPERLKRSFIMSIIFVLIGIGFWAFYKIFKTKKNHKHLHIHSEEAPIIHKHKHKHTHNITHQHKHPKDLKQSYFASFWIGILHGLAGISHFLILLPVLGFKSQTDSVLYIVGFGSGIILAMTTFAFVIGKIASSARTGHNDFFFNGIRLAGGLFAIIIGVYWCFSF